MSVLNNANPVEVAIEYRVGAVKRALGLNGSLIEAARMLYLPVGTLQSWKSLDEITVSEEGGVIFDDRLIERLKKYRRRLRSDVGIRLGSRPRTAPKSAPKSSEKTPDLRPNRIEGDGGGGTWKGPGGPVIGYAAGNLFSTPSRENPKNVVSPETISFLKDKVRELRKTADRLETEIRTLER
jgi:hypothetical protein